MGKEPTSNRTRRALLGAVGAGVGAALAGCMGSADPSSDSGTDRPKGDQSDLQSHAAATDLDKQPALGPEPGTADATIIVFEDPSCPSCGRFERETFPKLRSELIDSGRASYVSRELSFVKPWSDVAVPALEATFSRDESAFWTLRRFYYHHQDSLSPDTVRGATRRTLAKQTDVDASAVLADVDAGTFDDAVERDDQAARASGIKGTPAFFLFKDGSYVTDLEGALPVRVFKRSLGF